MGAQIKPAISDVAYVVFGFENLDGIEDFYTDFGLNCISRSADELVFRGTGPAAYCFVAEKADRPGLIGIGVTVADRAMLDAVAAFDEASSVEAIDRPGGGERVRLASPDGIPFEVVYGIEEGEHLPMREPLVFNHARKKARQGEWQRAPMEPASILRLGHVALLSPNYTENARWLTDRLGMLPSDVLMDGGPDNSIGGFFHCTGGGEWTDHHTIALFPAGEARVHHCSFEVQDLDAQFLGNKYLQSKDWTPLWGVGRHILGSQIFDYWFDPAGNVVEHFTDGDLVQPGKEPEYHQVSDDSLAQWGPPMPVMKFINRQPADA